jgi:homoserine kinase|tara:strand:+ start:2811 stop:3734 length:924 start_codon:yes stop_codon:yes gene_type:complete
MEWIKVFAPATVANIGPGFDILGMAVTGLGDVVEARGNESGVVISHIEGTDKLPMESEKNTAGIAASEVLKLLENPGGIEIKLKKGLPLGSGLGSSAASAAAGAFAANALYGNKLSKEELILPATKAEEKVSGFHADNTAPSLLGSAVLVRSLKPLDVIKLGTIDEITIVLVTPDNSIFTKEARTVLPDSVTLEKYVRNMANTSAVSTAFVKNDYGLFVRSLTDEVVEPERAKLINGIDEVKKAGLDAGADSVNISGSGPTLFAVINQQEEKANSIASDMVQAFSNAGRESKSQISRIDLEGTRIIP